MPTGLKSFNYSLLLTLCCVLSSCSDLRETPSTIPPSFLVDSVQISWTKTYLLTCNYKNNELRDYSPAIVHWLRLESLRNISTTSLDSIFKGMEGYYEDGDDLNIECFNRAQKTLGPDGNDIQSKLVLCKYGTKKYGIAYDCDPAPYLEIEHQDYILLRLAGRDSLPLLKVHKAHDYEFYPPGQLPELINDHKYISSIVTRPYSIKSSLDSLSFEEAYYWFGSADDGICPKSGYYIKVKPDTAIFQKPTY